MLISYDPKCDDYLTLVALSMNVALNQRCAETMCDNGNLEHLKQRALAYQDSLLMKVLRNLSTHDTTKKYFLVCNFIFYKVLTFRLIWEINCNFIHIYYSFENRSLILGFKT